METSPVSSDHHGLASIGRANVFDHARVSPASSATSCRASHLYCNFELIERATTPALGAMMNAEPTTARGVHNRATG
jgi:hypothetical protein